MKRQVALLSISLLLSQSAALSINTLPAAHRAAVPTFAARFFLRAAPAGAAAANARGGSSSARRAASVVRGRGGIVRPGRRAAAAAARARGSDHRALGRGRREHAMGPQGDGTPDSWMGGIWGGGEVQEFTLLSDGSVVWGGGAGGFGTGGRWSLKDGLLEVIRSTLLGLVTGRDYYMAEARAGVDEKLQFKLNGIIRSYNAIYPVMVIADFEATRRPGRFVRDVEDDEE